MIDFRAHRGIAQTFVDRGFVPGNRQNAVQMMIRATSKNGPYLKVVSIRAHQLYISILKTRKWLTLLSDYLDDSYYRFANMFTSPISLE